MGTRYSPRGTWFGILPKRRAVKQAQGFIRGRVAGFVPGLVPVPGLSLGLVLLLVGCQGSGVELHPVRGQLLVDGQPAAGATVVFEPLDPWLEPEPRWEKPRGIVSADGHFELTTDPLGRGAAAGRYKPCAVWYDANARQSDQPRSRLPARYATAATSPWPEVVIRPGVNQLEPFQVVSQARP